jgi:hypothetical protein
MKELLIPFLLAGAIACSTVKTGFDYDRQANFSNYKTYTFSESQLEQSIGQLNADRLIKAVEAELAKKGFSKSDSPDAIVDIHIKTEKKVSATANTTGMGYGRWGYAGGFSTTQINYDEYTDGTLFISIIDKASQKILWQGTGTKTLDENANADKRESNINYSVQQIMLNYPPEN